MSSPGILQDDLQTTFESNREDGENEACPASAVAGGLLLAAGVFAHSWRRLLLMSAGAALAYRGLTGDRAIDRWLGLDGGTERRSQKGVAAGHGFRFETELKVDVPVEKIYQRWQNLEGLPTIFQHIVAVTNIGDGRSHWIAEGPLGSVVEWEAEIINEKENEVIAWQSRPGSQIDTAGSIHFEQSPDGKSTDLLINLKYDPPAGKLGATIATLLGGGLKQRVIDDLQHFKWVMETSQQGADENVNSVPADRPVNI